MKTVVTGAAGFIGSHLCETLLAAGHEVTGVDSFLDYYPRPVKERNLEDWSSNPRFRFLEQDILDIDWMSVLDGVDVVYHLAAQAGVRASWGKSFLIYTRNNIEATQRMLEASKEKKLQRFVYASTSSVYGDTAEIPMVEESVLKPVSPYGVTKLAAEGLCYLYWKNYGVPCVALRYFTVYGPRQRPDMAFYRFLLAMLEGRTITIFEDGNQTRDFTYVEDIIHGTIAAAERGVDGRSYNLGGGSRITVNDVLAILAEVAGSKPDVRYSEKQKGDMRHTFASTLRAEQDLHYRPSVAVRDGLSRQYDWIRDQHRRGRTHRAN